MQNAKHIGGIWALAVALGMGMAVANTPAVALAAPDDTGKGSSSDGSSPSSSSPGTESHHPRRVDPPGAVKRSESQNISTTTDSWSSTEAATASATSDAPETDARRSRRGTPREESGDTSVKISPKPRAVDAPTTEPTARPSRRDAIRVVPAEQPLFASATPSAAAAPVAAITAEPTTSPAAPSVKETTPTVITPRPADPLSRLVSMVINAVLSPFANTAPTAPVQSPAEWTLLAFARREFEQASTPSTVVNTSGVTTSAVDPGFISSTHNFGLFSTTSAADPDDDHYVAFVLQTPFFTNVLTSGSDPEDNLGFGAASIGLPGHTVNTFISPFLTFSIAIPVTDPFAELFTELVRLGF
jgi:hypothetical protein